MITPLSRRARRRSMRVSAKPSVDLPQPDSPTRPTNSPASKLRSTSLTDQMRWPRFGSYTTFTPCAERIGTSLLPKSRVRQRVDAEVDERERQCQQRDREAGCQ